MSAAVATIPGSRCYWAVVPGECGASAQRLAFAFERFVPFSVDRLHLVSLTLPDGRLLVAGAEHETIAGLRQGGPGDAPWRLMPDALPRTLGESLGSEPGLAQLNFLSGPHEPVPVIRRNRLLIGLWMAACVISTILMVARTTSFCRTAASTIGKIQDEQRIQTDSALQGHADLSHLPPAARLLQAYRRLDRTVSGSRSGDCFLVLDRLWSSWPATQSFAIKDIRVTENSLMISGTMSAETLATVTGSIERLALPTGDWLLDPVSFPASTAGGETTLMLTWRPEHPAEARP